MGVDLTQVMHNIEKIENKALRIITSTLTAQGNLVLSPVQRIKNFEIKGHCKS